MKISVMTEPHMGGNYDQFLTIARWAEAKGLDSFARSDHFYADRNPRPEATEAFTHLAGLARDTNDIRLCVLVAPLTFRHPALLAKSAATIDQMSGGRLDLGVGTGWMEIEHQAFGLEFPTWAERFGRLGEYLCYLQAAFGEGRASFSGEYYQLSAEVFPKPENIRIIIGGSGPKKTPTLAGQFADEYNRFVGSPADIGATVTVLRQAAVDTGRDPDKITVSLMGPVIMGRDRAEFEEVMAERISQRSEDISLSEYEQKLTDAHAPAGTPDQVSEILSGWKEAGVSKYYIQWFDAADLDGLDFALQNLRAALP